MVTVPGLRNLKGPCFYTSSADISRNVEYGMLSIEVSRTISFDSASQIIDFLGTGYSSKGVAQASLSSLSPIYPSSSIVWLSNLLRKTSPRTERAGDTPVDIDEFAFKVVMFKRINHNLLDSISAESLSAFFGSLFSFANAEEKALKHTLIADLIANPYYSILAITVPTFLADNFKTLSRYILLAPRCLRMTIKMGLLFPPSELLTKVIHRSVPFPPSFLSTRLMRNVSRLREASAEKIWPRFYCLPSKCLEILASRRLMCHPRNRFTLIAMRVLPPIPPTPITCFFRPALKFIMPI